MFRYKEDKLETMYKYQDAKIEKELVRQMKKLENYGLVKEMISSAVSAIQCRYEYDWGFDCFETVKRPSIRRLVADWISTELSDMPSEYIKRVDKQEKETRTIYE